MVITFPQFVWSQRHAPIFFVLLCGGVQIVQAQGVPLNKGQGQARPATPSAQRPLPNEARRMEQEERRRLRQEIQRHGPGYRVTDKGLAAPALPAASPVLAPSQIAPVVPNIPIDAGMGLAAPAAGSALPTRAPAMSNEDRQQLRQQIREERRRGLYPTPSEVDR
jgi:uncharacterized membrane protein